MNCQLTEPLTSQAPRNLIGPDDPILVTGAAGFIGSRIVDALLSSGFSNVRCFVRPSSDTGALKQALERHHAPRATILVGNLLSREDCHRAVAEVALVYHLVTGRGKSFPGCFLNSVVTTRNLLDALIPVKTLRRFVNVSTFAVHSNLGLPGGSVFDETCPLEDNLERRFDAYVYAKLKQEELVAKYGKTHGIPYVTVRPTSVIGPGKNGIPFFVGIGTFGLFLHVGGSNKVPLTDVGNCADAIVLAGLREGVEGEAFQVVDDDLPTSRTFLRRYKERVGHFRSFYVPYPLFRLFCYCWERYSIASERQIPPVFNLRTGAFYWKRHEYSNRKLKDKLGWRPRVPMSNALDRHFSSLKEAAK